MCGKEGTHGLPDSGLKIGTDVIPNPIVVACTFSTHAVILERKRVNTAIRGIHRQLERKQASVMDDYKGSSLLLLITL